MLRVWGRTNSSNVMKVLWLLDELGLPFERIDAGGAFGRTGTAEYRAMNPLALVPTLEDDGFALFESNAILRYLCNAHAPGSPLYPTAPRARGTVDAWLDFQQTALNRPQSVVFAGAGAHAAGAARQRSDLGRGDRGRAHLGHPGRAARRPPIHRRRRR